MENEIDIANGEAGDVEIGEVSLEKLDPRKMGEILRASR